MEPLSATQQQTYLHFVEASMQVASRADFIALIRQHVEPVLPHRMCIAGVLRILPDFGIQPYQLLSINFPMAYLDEIQRPDGSIQSPILTRWAKTQEPQWFNPGTDTGTDITPEWLEIYKRHQFGSHAAHGVQDLYSNVTSYFCFCGMSDTPAHGYAYLLRLLVPHLHIAMLQALTREREAKEEQSSTPSLTARERELLALLLSGKSNAEIAQLQQRSEKTIKNQLHSLYGKLAVRTRGQAIHRANSLRGESLVIKENQ